MITSERDYIIWVLSDCAGEQFKEPRRGLKESEFSKRCYQEWALQKVLDYIRDPKYPPMESLKRLRKKLAKSKPTNKGPERVRSELLEMLDWAIDILTAMKGDWS